MKRVFKSFLGLALAVSMVFGCFTTTAFAAGSSQSTTPTGYVTIDAEKFTLGQGYIKEPVLAPIYEGDSVASVLKRVLGDGNYKEKTTQYGTYFEALRDSGTEPLNIPEYITEAIGISNASNTGLVDSGWLGEFDYSASTYSGWLYSDDNANTNVGAASWTPKNGDVIRFQFSLCMGTDLGAALSYDTPYVDAANKDTLTAQLAKVNSSSYKNGILTSYAEAYSNALTTAKNMEATQAETDSAASALSKAYDQYLANISSGSSGSHHSSSGGSSTNTVSTAATTSASTVITSSTAAGGSISTVSTQPDTAPVMNGNQSNVSVTVPSELATVISTATAEKPAEIKITTPTASMIEQINNSAVKAVDLTIKVPAAVANNTNSNAKISINADASVLQAAKDAQKDITLSVTNSDTGKEVYSWTFSGSDLKNSVTSVTNVNLVLNVSSVKNVSAASSVVAGNTADKQASGIVLQFGNSGLLPGMAKVKVYVGDQEGCTPNSKVFLYYLNSTAKALEQMPQSDYTVDANGYATISISHCSDYVLLPKAATNPYPVKSDTPFSIGVKSGKSYTFGLNVSGKAIPTFTIGNSKAFTSTVKRIGNKYYFTVKAVGAVGTTTAVYSTLQGQKPVVVSYVAVTK